MKRVVILLIIGALTACNKKDTPSPKTTEQEIIDQYLLDNELTAVETAEGVYQYEITDNPGGNTNGDIISIYYTLTNLETAEVIDSHQSIDGDPVKLHHNAGRVFPLGLDYGLAGMGEGETYGIIVPSDLGYGGLVLTGIDSVSILHFEVEVVTRETEAEVATSEESAIANFVSANQLNNLILNPVDSLDTLSNGIYLKRTAYGVGGRANSGDSITISYVGYLLNMTAFDQLDNFKYKFDNQGVIDGLDIGVSTMLLGESATLFIPSAQAYKGSVRFIPESIGLELVAQKVIPLYATKVGPFETLAFDVTLITIH